MRAVSTVASGLRRSAVAIAEALVVAAINAAILLALSPVYKPADFLAGTERAQAARGGGNRDGGGTTASCTISPNPIAAYDRWTVIASGLPTGAFDGTRMTGAVIHIQIDNGTGVTGWKFQTADGTYSYTTASPAGTTTVTFSDWTHGKPKPVATCTVTVS